MYIASISVSASPTTSFRGGTLGMVGNIHGDRSVGPNQIAIDGLDEALGG